MRSGLSLPAVSRPGSTRRIYLDIITALRQRGRKVMLDTSGAPFPLALEAKPSAIKPNIHEFEEYIGRTLPNEKEVVAAARELISRGIELVVVSMGKEGACFVTARRRGDRPAARHRSQEHGRGRGRDGGGRRLRPVAEAFVRRVRPARHRLFRRQTQPPRKRAELPQRHRSRDGASHLSPNETNHR